MFFSTKALQDVRRIEDPLNLATEVAHTVFAKELANTGVAMKASSNFLIQPFSLAFSASIPPMESSRASPVTQ
jgi:hypothetical protein